MPFLPFPFTISFNTTGSVGQTESGAFNWIMMTTKAPRTKPSATARMSSLKELCTTGSGLAPHSQWQVTNPASCLFGFQLKLLNPMPMPAMKIPLIVSGSMRLPPKILRMDTAAPFVKLHLIVVTSYWSYITYVLHTAHIYSIYVYTLCIRFVCVFGADFGFVTVFVMASSCALAMGTVLLVAGTCQPNTLGLCQKDLPRICVHQDGKYKEGTYPGWFWEVISEIGLSWVEKRCSRIWSSILHLGMSIKIYDIRLETLQFNQRCLTALLSYFTQKWRS